ncbi:hypothetical protein BRD00_14035 [Halobacteriales archaeon QS_8_69_26]|nr:MAG: hypothetical protein BRD00_14035 [Halobacteriales archaeon QS_8_69_26]
MTEPDAEGPTDADESADGGAGTLSDTYAAAIQHDIADVPDGATLAGVVRTPTAWFHPLVDENHPALGPPEGMLSEFQDHREDLEVRGMCDEGTHNAAWEELDFVEEYREYLDGSDEAQGVMEDLADRVRSGEDVALVCYENTDSKRCHRTVLRDRIAERI